MAVRRWWPSGFLNAGDEIGCVDTLWPLRVFISMELKEHSGNTTSATVLRGLIEYLLLGPVRVDFQRTAERPISDLKMMSCLRSDTRHLPRLTVRRSLSTFSAKNLAESMVSVAPKLRSFEVAQVA